MRPAFSAILLGTLWALPVAFAETPGQVAVGSVVRRMYGAMEWDSAEALTIIGAAFEIEPPD